MGLIPLIIIAKNSKRYYSSGSSYSNDSYNEYGHSYEGHYIRNRAEEKATMKIEKKIWNH